MPKICEVAVPVVLAWVGGLTCGFAQDDGETVLEPQSSTGIGFVTVANMTGLKGPLGVRINGRNPLDGQGYESGDDTGQIGLPPGGVRIEVAHSLCPRTAKATLNLGNGHNQMVLAFAHREKDPDTGLTTYRLGLTKLPQDPSPGKCRITVFACDTEGVIGAVKINAQTIQTLPMKPVSVPDVAVERSYTLKGVRGGELEPFLIIAPEHYYCVVYPIEDTREIGGTWLLDDRVTYNSESEAKARQRIREQQEKERLAMLQWEEYQKKLQSQLKQQKQP